MSATLYTLGYMASSSNEKLARLMADPKMMLIDVRLSAFSRYRPSFRRKALMQRYAHHYLHVPQLGNVNYRDRTQPMVIADPVVGLPFVLCRLESGYSVCLLCGCSDIRTCHRRVVSDLLLVECPELQVIHL